MSEDFYSPEQTRLRHLYQAISEMTCEQLAEVYETVMSPESMRELVKEVKAGSAVALQDGHAHKTVYRSIQRLPLCKVEIQDYDVWGRHKGGVTCPVCLARMEALEQTKPFRKPVTHITRDPVQNPSAPRIPLCSDAQVGDLVRSTVGDATCEACLKLHWDNPVGDIKGTLEGIKQRMVENTGYPVAAVNGLSVPDDKPFPGQSALAGPADASTFFLAEPGEDEPRPDHVAGG